jgi:hypothetical protein
MRERDSLPGFHVPKEFQKKGHAQMAKHEDADDVDDDAEADIGHAADDESEEELNSSPAFSSSSSSHDSVVAAATSFAGISSPGDTSFFGSE